MTDWFHSQNSELETLRRFVSPHERLTAWHEWMFTTTTTTVWSLFFCPIFGDGSGLIRISATNQYLILINASSVVCLRRRCVGGFIAIQMRSKFVASLWQTLFYLPLKWRQIQRQGDIVEFRSGAGFEELILVSKMWRRRIRKCLFLDFIKEICWIFFVISGRNIDRWSFSSWPFATIIMIKFFRFF